MVLEASRTVEVDAPIDRCYELAADIERAPDWQETLLDVEVLERDDQRRPLLVETTNDVIVRKARTTVRFSYDPPNGLSWEQEEGDAKWMKGRWEFEDLGDGRTRLHAQSLTDSFEGRDAWLASGMETGVEEGYAKLEGLLADGSV